MGTLPTAGAGACWALDVAAGRRLTEEEGVGRRLLLPPLAPLPEGKEEEESDVTVTHHNKGGVDRRHPTTPARTDYWSGL